MGYPIVEPLLTRGAALAALGEYRKALTDFDAAVKLCAQAGDPDALIQRSALYDKVGETVKAAADWAAARKLDEKLRPGDRPVIPDPPKPPERKKLTAEEKEKFDAALAEAEAAWKQRKLDACRTAIDEAVRIDPTCAPARALRARLFAQAGGDFLAEANETVRLDPTNAWGYTVRGSAKIRNRDYAGTVADNTIAVTLDPTNASAWNNRGHAYAAWGRYHQALADLDEALRQKPGYSAVYSNRAGCYLSLGEYQKALADYQKAAAAEPTNPRWPMYCSVLRAELGDKAGAEADRALALERGWDPRTAAPTLPPPVKVKRDPEP